MIQGIFVEGLLYGIMVLGVFITFRILDFPDLTVDGSFPFGAAIMASAMTSGINPWLSLLLAFIGGIAAGFVTAAIHNYLKVPNLMAGILTMTMLWSINIRVMNNRSNIALTQNNSILDQVGGALAKFGISSDISMLLFFVVFTMAIKLLLDVFFRTDLGLTMGALGNNPQMVISTGVNPKTLKLLGLGLSNGLVAVSGAFASQYQGFADVNLGQGTIIAGLASVMLGEFILRSNRIWLLTFRVILGSILFRALMYLARYYGYDIGLFPTDQRLLTGLLIILALGVSMLRERGSKFRLADAFYSRIKRGKGNNGNDA